jgi:two-component system CheB/CheR fusion protein
VKTNGDVQTIHLHISPQMAPKQLAGRFLVVFEDVEDPLEGNSEENGRVGSDSTGIAELEKELQHTRESHQITVEELESSNEELRSTNEELQSSNEELQSINEELESSKEELQSLNEELQTMNSELENNLEELSRAHDDMRNLLNSNEVATIFIDNDLRVRRFTPEATKLVNLIQTDIGRPLKHVATNIQNDDMINEVCGVLENLKSKNKEVRTKKGEWYKMRVMPYRTTNNKIDGAVITFNSIDEQKKSQILVRQVFDMNPGPLAVLDKDGKLVIANDSFSDLFEIKDNNPEGEDFFFISRGVLKEIDLKKMMQKALDSGKSFETADFEMEFEDKKKKYLIQGEIIPETEEFPQMLLSLREKKERP